MGPKGYFLEVQVPRIVANRRSGGVPMPRAGGLDGDMKSLKVSGLRTFGPSGTTREGQYVKLRRESGPGPHLTVKHCLPRNAGPVSNGRLLTTPSCGKTGRAVYSHHPYTQGVGSNVRTFVRTERLTPLPGNPTPCLTPLSPGVRTHRLSVPMKSRLNGV